MLEEQLVIPEVLPAMEYKEIEKKVIKMLRDYPKLAGRIRIEEMKAEGRKLPFQGIRLSMEEEQMATVGRAYSTDIKEHMHQEKAENLFHAVKGDDPEDEQVLDKIRELMIGTEPWGGQAVVFNGVVMPHDKADAMKITNEHYLKALKLTEERDIIDRALWYLTHYKPQLEQLLQLRFIKRKSVVQVAKELNISERSFDNWKKEAISEFANLIGLIDG